MSTPEPSTKSCRRAPDKICPASWNKVNQNWSSDLYRRLSCRTAFTPSHRVAPLRWVPESSGIRTTTTPADWHSVLTFFKISSNGSRRDNVRMRPRTRRNSPGSNAGQDTLLASISPHRSQAATALGEAANAGDDRYAATALSRSKASGLLTPKNERRFDSVSPFDLPFSIKPYFTSSITGNLSAQVACISNSRCDSCRANAYRYCASRLVQNRADIPRALSSWIAVSDVIAAFPFTISLTVLTGRPSRCASSDCVMPRSCSASRRFSPGATAHSGCHPG